MKFLVIGGTGTVGSEVVKQLLRRGEKVRVLTSSPGKLANLPPGAEGAVGDLRNPSSLPPAFQGVDGVFMATAMSRDETAQGLAAVDTAKAARVRCFVYMSVHRASEAPHIPHFGSKLPIENAVAASGIQHSILSPNSFFQTDFFFRDAILQHGIYPQPLGSAGSNRVDVRDIAEAAANCLTQAGHNGKNYPLVGPDSLTGPQIAEILSRHLGREVRYGGDDLDAWAAHAKQVLPEWMVAQLRTMYDYIQRHGLGAAPGELAQVRALLGRVPRTYESFVAELAPAWKVQAAAR
jgi:uncharacterized protein YbjT (DUF2867 family)